MGALHRMWLGQEGLAKTYWIYGVLTFVLAGIGLSLVTPGSALAMISMLAFCCYVVIWSVGIWRSASTYTGPAVWSALAKVVAAINLLWGCAVIVIGIGMVLGLIDSGRPPHPAELRQDGGAQVNPKPLETAPTTQPPNTSIDKDGKPCTQITEFLGECKR